MTGFKDRILGAAKLDADLYEELRLTKAQCLKPWVLLYFPV